MRRKNMLLAAARTTLILTLAAAALLAQPPVMRRRPAGSAPAPAKTGSEVPALVTSGVLTSLDAEKLVMQAEDRRVLTYKVTKSTKFTRPADKLAPGDHLIVEAEMQDGGGLHAVLVKFEKAGDPLPATTESGEPADAVDPVVMRDARGGNENRPKLRRGPRDPAQRAPAEQDDPPPAVVREVPPPSRASQPAQPPADPVIDAAREQAVAFVESLPNYIVQQFTTRYQSADAGKNWRAIDVVSAEVVYENRKESYRNVAINGKKTGKGMQDLDGAWSTGEFGTALVDLFSPATNARFTYKREETAARRPARVYDFAVEQEFSHWNISTPGQAVKPAYRGSVWVDKGTKRVLRIETQAVKIPKLFPLDTVESAIDYDVVRLGTGDYLLPVKAENLGCQRGTSQCFRTVIEFRNYKKFSGESSITFEK